MRRVLLILGLALLTTTASAATARAQLEAFLDGLSAMSARFSQRVLDETGKVVESSGGEFFVQRPGKFRWSYKTPYEQEIIGAHERVWVYDSELEQVSIKPIGDALGASPALLLIHDQPLDELFDVTDLGAYDSIDWLELKPKQEDASFASFRIGMAGGALKLMELKDNFGQRTQLSFADIARNPKLEASLFTFIPPEGADVIGGEPKQ